MSAEQWATEICDRFAWITQPPVSATGPEIEFAPNARDYTEVRYFTRFLSIRICVTGWENALLTVSQHTIKDHRKGLPSAPLLEVERWESGELRNSLPPEDQLQHLSDVLRAQRDSLLVAHSAE
jgi:hypothetical protein